MSQNFEFFVIFAEMRTGSNFLEESVNEYPGLHCYGEVYNPHFIGHAKQSNLLGMTLLQREAEPTRLVSLMKDNTDGLPGFRFFHDHDPRIKALCLADPTCAKIILTRNPVESYVSREIVRQTGQWRLGDARAAKTAKIRFDPATFEKDLAARQAFQIELLHTLQCNGQTAFYLDYEDISDIDVLNGLARFLGVQDSRAAPSNKTKKQNPQTLEDKVVNFDEMTHALQAVDHFNLSRTPSFEPRRGPAVPAVIAAAETPILFVPIKGGPTQNVITWLAELDGVEESVLGTGFNQKSLRQWKRQAKGHRSFAVIRHPVARLHAAFITHILMPGPDCYGEIRETLRRSYGVSVPDGMPDASYDRGAHRAAFLQFAEFVKANLAGQTSIRVDSAWASQSEILRGVGQFMILDHVFREEDLASDFCFLAGKFGRESPALLAELEASPVSLSSIGGQDVDAAVKAAYQKDYMLFGFGPYRPDQAA